MPVNAGPEYFAAEDRYLKARTKEEKIATLEEMIRTLPKHKSSENVLAQLRKRLAKLKSQKTVKATAKPKFIIRKEGAAQICIIGLTNCGKSSLLKTLTKADVEIADYPYTTKKPKVGMMPFGDVQLQLIEIPSTFDPESLSLLRTCDEILVLLDATQDIHIQEEKLNKLLSENHLKRKRMVWVLNKTEIGKPGLIPLNISVKKRIGIDRLKEDIWNNLSLIRIYTKSPGKPKKLPALALPKTSTVRDVARSVHKEFVKNFKFARVFNNSRFSGQKVGLEYELKDLDVVEIHTR